MLETLPIGASLPLREALQRCRADPPAGTSSSAQRPPLKFTFRRRLPKPAYKYDCQILAADASLLCKAVPLLPCTLLAGFC